MAKTEPFFDIGSLPSFRPLPSLHPFSLLPLIRPRPSEMEYHLVPVL